MSRSFRIEPVSRSGYYPGINTGEQSGFLDNFASGRFYPDKVSILNSSYPKTLELLSAGKTKEAYDELHVNFLQAVKTQSTYDIITRTNATSAGQEFRSTREPRLFVSCSDAQLVSEMEFRRLQKLGEVCARKLGAEFREVFTLRAWQNWEYAEIAAVQGISPALVRWRFFRARQQIRARLSRWFDMCEKGHE